ncbi:hypothetical protein CFC21_059106 [Triticum aestivum]|uniref:Uncharacterized protein n=2 Tax=Triticum aestivum TaxID=4565 RepID=A0A3B6IVX6_WHEAT|nr:uncharacterized protein LOC123093520 [Triticum aestivum]KAF7050788.1 hypothetical protein CFC21_059106 [Triticum aestivum]
MEGPHPLPEPEAGTGTEEPVTGRRCGRHPDQPLNGVCSACLVERLSSVRSPEIVEVASSSSRDPDARSLPVPVPASGDQEDQGKLRRTLMLLFQMDDSGAAADRPGANRPPDAKDPGASEADHPGGGGRKWMGASWLRAILPRRGARRRGTKEEEEEPSRPSGAVDPHPGDASGGPSPPLVERRASFRRSCEWMICREPPRGSSLDPPRHSWDGSMVGRAFACSFACLDEPSDGVTRVRQGNAEESARERPAAEVAAESRNGGHSADVGGEGPRFRGRRSCSDAGPEITVAASGVRRRRSNRWSRVWDRSITSPLKEFVRKGEHALDRSFSESRRETRRCKNGEMTDIENGEIQHGRNGSVLPGRASQGSSRSSQAAVANGDAQNFRVDWLKNKECRIGRSRSVHYTSPGNFDNGMLRFYLTPMRSNRAANRGRRRSSRLFGRGLFGFV